MSMIKRTIVLSRGDARGYVTIVRIGSETGAKLVVTDMPAFPTFFVLKLGENAEFVSPVDGEVNEYSLDTPLLSRDAVGVMLVDAEANVYCAGGRRELINKKYVKEKLLEMTAKVENGEPVVEFEETEVEVYDNNLEEEISAASEELAEEVEEPVEEPIEETVAEVEEVDAEETPEAETLEEEIEPQAEETSEELTLPTEAEKVEELNVPPVKDGFSLPTGANFYRSARAQLEEIMTAHPRENTLSDIIPDSEWVRVEYDKNEYYVVGILKEDGKTTHIGYGVPGVEEVKPPKEIEDLCDFLPLPNGNGKGYWLMFQNPEDGAMIKN